MATNFCSQMTSSLPRHGGQKSVEKIFQAMFQTNTTREETIKLRKLLPNFLKAEASFNNTCAYGPVSKYTSWLTCNLFLSVEDPDYMNKLVGLFSLVNPGFICLQLTSTNSLCAEQIEIASSKIEGELLTWDDVRKMKYSSNVVCDALRLALPISGTFREALADFVYKDFTIPGGWKLIWNVNSTHKNPEFFPEPEKFDPSRLEGSGPAPYTYVPFGEGPKMCPRSEFAGFVIFVFLYHLVKRFKWKSYIANEKLALDPIPFPAKGLPCSPIPSQNLRRDLSYGNAQYFLLLCSPIPSQNSRDLSYGNAQFFSTSISSYHV